MTSFGILKVCQKAQHTRLRWVSVLMTILFFAPVGEAFIAEFGANAPTTTGGKSLPHVGHRVSRIDVQSGQVHAFALNRTGLSASETSGGGFERPIDAVFDSNGALYIADFGLLTGGSAVPGTGVIWRITRET